MGYAVSGAKQALRHTVSGDKQALRQTTYAFLDIVDIRARLAGETQATGGV